jgi:nucleoside-diphosphate-sugar epimerase
MKIFISGATSSIGAYVVKLLLEQGHSLNLLVRNRQNSLFVDNSNVCFFEGDLSNEQLLQTAMKDCDQAYHMAAIAKVWLKDPKVFFETNLSGTVNFLNAAYKNMVTKIVVTSTAGVYGPSIHSIITENKNREMDFFNEYESSKALSELKIKEYVIEKKMDIVIVSPTRVYGPLLHGKPASTNLMIEKFINGSWRILPGTGKEIGNYAYIEDVANGHLLAMLNGESGHTYILGGENCSYSLFYNHLGRLGHINRRMLRVPLFLQNFIAGTQLFFAKRFGIEPSITPKWVAKVKYDWEVSSKKAIEELGYNITPLEEGLKKTINYLEKVQT